MSIIERVVNKTSDSDDPKGPAAAAAGGEENRRDTVSRLTDHWANASEPSAQDASVEAAPPGPATAVDLGSDEPHIDPFVFENEPTETAVDPLEHDPLRAPSQPPYEICLAELLPEPHYMSLDPNDPSRAQLRQEYRRIKRPLLFSVRNNQTSVEPVTGPNMILVTSALRGEGKTTNALNLALSIASEVDYHVLLIDGDLQLASISRLLGVADRKGLIDVLQDRAVHLPDVLVRTEADNLTILPAGTTVTHANELVASQAMFDLMAEIASRYDDRIIVIDSAPLMASSDPAVLARMVGQVALIVAADSTPQNLLDEALDMLPRDDNVGIILNKASTSIGESEYGYY